MLRLYYDPDTDPETRAAMRQEFVVALRSYPNWAVQRAFDAWVKMGSRRPAPAEIVALAQKEIQPLTDELARRKREHDERAALAAPSRTADDRERARQVMEAAGFTPRRMEALRHAPMASSVEEIAGEVEAPRKPHWSETVDPDGPEMAQLRAARAANPLVQAALRGPVRMQEGAAE